jgi:hypothetical protein
MQTGYFIDVLRRYCLLLPDEKKQIKHNSLELLELSKIQKYPIVRVSYNNISSHELRTENNPLLLGEYIELTIDRGETQSASIHLEAKPRYPGSVDLRYAKDTWERPGGREATRIKGAFIPKRRSTKVN